MLETNFNPSLPHVGNVHRIAQRFCQLVSANFRKIHSVQEYAKLLCISYERLKKACHFVLHTSPKHYIENLLKEELIHCLIHTDDKIDIIASRFGFCDESHLNKFFKNKTGRTPGAYRKYGPLPPE